jgi:putative alpha-1,2-mannosidase
MAKAVADVNDPDEKQGGFASGDSEITGFSHSMSFRCCNAFSKIGDQTSCISFFKSIECRVSYVITNIITVHDSGTGGAPSLGNFPFFPQTGCPGDLINNCLFTKTDRASRRLNNTVQAHPGYFAISLNTSIHTEMTVTNHTAVYRLTFPANSTTAAGNATALPYSPLILFDLTDLPESRINGSIAVDGTTARITGNGTFNPSFGLGTYDLHFCADFSGAKVRDTGVFMNNRAGSEPKAVKIVPNGNTPLIPAGAWAQFKLPDNDQILIRVGLSFFSTEQACHNAETEIPDFGFDKVLKAAEDVWREKLSVIEVDATGVSDELQTVFWSGTYRAMISPQVRDSGAYLMRLECLYGP